MMVGGEKLPEVARGVLIAYNNQRNLLIVACGENAGGVGLHGVVLGGVDV